MSFEINGDMLALARESRDLTQTALAAESGVPHYTISRVESRLTRHIREDYLDRIASVTGYSRAFFTLADGLHGFGTSCTYHRRRQATLVHELRLALARINVRRIQIFRLLEGMDINSPYKMRQFDIDENDSDPEAIAALVRAEWRLPFGPIRNLIRTIEHAGGIVVITDLGTQRIDALSQWLPGLPPMFFLNSGIPADRMRYSLAHELGHIIMHSSPSECLEREADQFAAAFLMPQHDIVSELDRIRIADLARLKSYWRVSMQALVRRARDLGKITQSQYTTAFEQFSRMGYRKNEPVEIEPEMPSTLERLIEARRNHGGYSDAELAEIAMISEEEFAAVYLGRPPGLRLVDSG
jgi:Zn-dependent peptidase ImmA (M78 family)